MKKTCMLATLMAAILFLSPAGGAFAGESALMQACAAGDYDRAKALVDGGADVNERGGEYQITPLMKAARSGNTKLVLFLLEHKADVAARNSNGVTPIMYAAPCEEGKDNVETVRILLDAGADVEGGVAETKHRITPLMRTAETGAEESAKLLLSRGANVNARSADGKTSLMYAATHGRAGVAKILLDAGAEINAEDKDRNTALSLAVRGRHKEVAALLESRGGAVPEGANTSAWEERRDKSPMDDSEEYVAGLDSEESNARLVLRCSENRSDAYISTGKYIGFRETVVEYRFDSEKALKKSWGLSTTGKGFFAPKPIDFMKKLAKSKKLTVRVVPYSDSPMISTFNLEGVETIVGNVSQICKWKK